MSASSMALAMMLGGAPVSPIDTPVATTISAPVQVADANFAAATTPTPPAESATAEPASSDHDGITVIARDRQAPDDPLEAVNHQSFAVTQAVDKAVIGPVAHAYERTVPKPARNGLRNFFRNLHEPVVFVNFLLQLKPGKAAETLGRFAINSTVGAAGLIDVAKTRPFNLPFRPNGFANSLAYYGVKPGPFLYLPIIGATTLRDLVGRSMDTVIYPIPGGRPISGGAYAATSTTVKALNRRVDFDGTLHELRDDNPHAYASLRQYYLAKRAAEVAALHTPRRRSDTRIELSGPVSIPSPPIP
ncbi:MAG: VacJ family lipoprotein [Sphingobium sp.]